MSGANEYKLYHPSKGYGVEVIETLHKGQKNPTAANHELSFTIPRLMFNVILKSNPNLLGALTKSSNRNETIIVLDTAENFPMRNFDKGQTLLEFGIVYNDTIGKHSSIMSVSRDERPKFKTYRNLDPMRMKFKERFYDEYDLSYLERNFTNKAGLYIKINTSGFSSFDRFFTEKFTNFVKRNPVRVAGMGISEDLEMQEKPEKHFLKGMNELEVYETLTVNTSDIIEGEKEAFPEYFKDMSKERKQTPLPK